MKASQRVIVFVKAPRPGQVKTRLAREMGPETAAEIYRSLVAGLVKELEKIHEVELHFAPEDARQEILPWLQSGWGLRPQHEGDLGLRMRRAFQTAWADDIDRVILIGSDCPHLRRSDLQEAWAALDEHEVVLGPARDGGYWLIGLRRDQPGLFTDIEWSGPRVLQTTLERCRAGGLSVRLLRELQDVDTGADWRRFRGPRKPRSQAKRWRQENG